jgi:adenylate cyclase
MKSRPVVRGIVAGVVVALIIGAVAWTDHSLFGLEYLFYDPALRQIALEHPPDPHIVIVAINETTMHALEADYGRWPFSREVMAMALDTLRTAGARAVAIDIIYTGEDARYPEGDRLFGEALAQAPAVLAVQTEISIRGAEVPSDLAAKLWTSPRSAGPMFLLRPQYGLLRRVPAIGTIRFGGGSSTARSYPLLDRLSTNRYVPSLALAAAALSEGWRHDVRPASGTSVIAGPRLIPLDSRGGFGIRWHRAPMLGATAGKSPDSNINYQVIAFEKLLLLSMVRNDQAAAAAAGVTPAKVRAALNQFRDKIVLIGLTATGAEGGDFRPTPLSSLTAGVEYHANALDTLLHGDFLRDTPPFSSLVILLLAMSAFGTAVGATRSQIVAAAIALFALALWAACGYLALRAGWVMQPMAGLVATVAAFLVITLFNFIYEQRESLQLRTTFGRYVSPQILEHVLAHPESVQLGGERRDLTILFSDIRGFTSISEAAEPEDVVEMLNEYLTRMVEILLRHGGTLDKFIGDAVMGFWNAPTPDPDHPGHAVDCAIEMIEETTRLRQRWMTEGKAALRIGIGINSGDAVVGNIGSERVFGYTVIGDAVNLAARLESKNKDYSTEIIISEFTLARIGDRFITVYLDEVKVKGKENAVKIYEVRGRT